MIGSILAEILRFGLAPMVSGFSWFQLLPGMSGPGNLGETLGLSHPEEVFFIPTTWVVVLVVLALAAFARMGLDRAMARQGNDKYFPDDGMTARNAAEILAVFLRDMVASNIGKNEVKAFFPLVSTLFIYILFANLSGFIPGFLPPTDNFSSNFAMAAMVFATFMWVGLTRDPVGFIKHLAGPMLALSWLIFPLEALSLVIRPFSLTVRLTVNIFVDHLLQQIARDVGGIVPVIGAALVPVPLYALGLLVCVIQAFIFALLTCIYIGLSMPHHDHDAHAAHH